MNLLQRIFRDRKKIIEGVKNTLFKKSEIEAIAQERMTICLTCDTIDHEGTKCAVPGTAPCCGDCGCKLAFKTRSLSSQCTHPDGPKWKARLSQKEEDELYSKINYDPNGKS